MKLGYEQKSNSKYNKDSKLLNGHLEINYEHEVELNTNNHNNDSNIILYQEMDIPMNLNSLKKLNINGIEVLFPYEPYEPQITYMEEVIRSLNESKHGLLQSPTGTGKTLCMLCATIAWVNNLKKNLKINPSTSFKEPRDNNIPKIIYCSRTHSQLKQVVKELKATQYKVTMAILASRSRTCMINKIKSLSPNYQQTACKYLRKKTKKKDVSCSFYSNLELYKDNLLQKYHSKIYDIEELIQFGHEHCICPYYYEKDLQKHADIILMPYNYILDHSIRRKFEINIQNSIIIIDEAHNIDNVCEEDASFDLSIKHLQNCIKDANKLKKAIENIDPTAEDPPKTTLSNLEKLIQPIKTLGTNLSKWKIKIQSELSNKDTKGRTDDKNNEDKDKDKEEDHGIVLKGDKIFELFKDMTKCKNNLIEKSEFSNGLNVDNLPTYLDILRTACKDLDNIIRNSGGFHYFNKCVSMIYRLQKDYLDWLKGIGNRNWIDIEINSYYVYCHTDKKDKKEKKNFILSFWCLNPGISFSQIVKNNPRSILLTSGTLQPLGSFEYEFMTKFPIKLLNKHVIDSKKQVYMGIIRKGCNGTPMNFSFKNREDTKIIIEAGNSLVSLAKVIPRGMLVFFGSYAIMKRYLNLWKDHSVNVIKNLQKYKTIFKEVKNQEKMKTIMKEYTKAAKNHGAILFGICRGNSSEGIDFPDDMARAVVMIGVPYPCIGDKRVELKQEFLKEYKNKGGCLSPEEWYLLKTIRAANQAMGRVIRNKDDFGTVLLMDERFSEGRVMKEYPSWLKENIEFIDQFGFIIPRLVKFYKGRIPELGSVSTHYPQNMLESIDKMEILFDEDDDENDKPNINKESMLLKQFISGDIESEESEDIDFLEKSNKKTKSRNIKHDMSSNQERRASPISLNRMSNNQRNKKNENNDLQQRNVWDDILESQNSDRSNSLSFEQAQKLTNFQQGSNEQQFSDEFVIIKSKYLECLYKAHEEFIQDNASLFRQNGFKNSNNNAINQLKSLYFNLFNNDTKHLN